ncbi:MAG: tetratricopeptide repeat protein [Syntrophobacteraceae bacterium]|nr:tetratricopeptide repeat protein [Syntrophobacteraceae bacterium]
MISPRDRAPGRLTAALAACILSLVVAGCGTKEEKVAKFISRGDALLEAGSLDKAILEYKNAIQIDPKAAAPRLSVGKAYLAQKDIRQAYQSLTAAVELDPSLDAARIELASLLATAAMGKEALDHIAKLVKPEAHQPKVDLIKARALVSMKKHPEAIELLRGVKDGNSSRDVQALLTIGFREVKDFQAMEGAALRWRSLDPRSPAPYLVLAQHAVQQGDKQRAVKELDALVSANEQSPVMALLRAQTLSELGMKEEADKAFEALPAEPDLIKARADHYVKMGKADKARESLVGLLASNPADADAAVRLSRILVAGGRLDDAIGWLDKSLGVEMEKADRERLMLAKASILADQRKVDEALRLADEVLKQNQGSLEGHFLVGSLLLAAGKAEEAEIHLNQVVTGRPENVTAHSLLARSQFINNKEGMALETLKSGVKANAASVELRLDLVRALLAGKDTDQAVRVLSDGLSIKADEPLLLRARGEIFTAARDYSRAETDFRKVVELQPGDPGGFLEMGRLMLAQGKSDDAMGWYRKAMEKEGGWQQALPILLSIHLERSDAKAALALAEEQVKKHPDAALAHHLLGQILLRGGNSARAQAAFIKATELAPDWLEPYRGLIEAYKKDDRGDKVLVKLEEIHGKRPSSATTLVLAQLLEERQKFDEANRLYQDLIEKSGQSPSVMNDVAFLFAERRTSPKDLDLAADLAARALSMQPENPAYLDTVAWIAFKQGKVEDAWLHLQQALQKSPGAGTVHYHAAVVAHARGDRKSAMEFLDKALQQPMDPLSLEAAMKLKKEWEG